MMTRSYNPDGTSPQYPLARQGDQRDLYFGTAVADPYRWMEDVDSPEVKVWVDAENALTQRFLSGDPEVGAARGRIHARLMELVDFERFSPPEHEAGRFFYRRNSGLQNQAVLLWQIGLEGEPQTLLDPNTLSPDGTIALGSTAVSEDGALLAYALSDAGSDIETIHVRRIDTGDNLPDQIQWVKFSGITWLKDASRFFYSSFGAPEPGSSEADALKTVGGFHKLYLHRLGTPQSEDAILFERRDDAEILVGGGLSEDGRWLFLLSSKGSYNALAMRDLATPASPDIVVANAMDATYEPFLTIGDTLWMKTNKDAPRSRIVKVDLRNPAPEHWSTLVPEGPDQMESATAVHDVLFLTYLADAQTRIDVYTLDGERTRTLVLPGIGSAGVQGGRRDDTETFFTFTNYTTPAAIFKLDLATFAATPWKAPQLRFDPAQYESTLAFAPSKDGTRIPLFITYRKGLVLDGTAPAILYGYGGFNVSLGPAYASSRLVWMEMGGIYAEAILRGGGEYGEAWHQAGTKLNKQNVFDDFIGCAEFLIAAGYTSPTKLAIQGGSNGGLLVGAVELQRPELFGAALPQVGVMDMLRFDKFTIGYAWKSDYGSPSENEEEFRAILRYSPVHNVRAGVRYPPTLVLTADHDDRVFPAHSFKFAAAMQSAAAQTANSAPMLIRVEVRAGHGAGMPLSKQLDVTADMYTFLIRALSINPVKILPDGQRTVNGTTPML
jgi:prolyl oligopeptidase